MTLTILIPKIIIQLQILFLIFSKIHICLIIINKRKFNIMIKFHNLIIILILSLNKINKIRYTWTKIEIYLVVLLNIIFYKIILINNENYLYNKN
jgi:hypothetical protein